MLDPLGALSQTEHKNVKRGNGVPSKPANVPNKGGYGIILLFDGVSSVVNILKDKIGYARTAIILAETDDLLRGLVCPEFGYRSDGDWGYTVDGSACIYVKDAKLLLDNECRILQQASAMFPDLKWIVVGGSPCQDLMYAGPLHGLLGLVGAHSRLFFALLCAIRTMQILIRVQNVRFLVGNAGSMQTVHLVTFCKLVGLPYEPFDRYIWRILRIRD